MSTWSVLPLLLDARPAEEGEVRAVEEGVAGASRTVLPQHVHRRRSGRDAVLPLVLSLELLAGMAYGALRPPPRPDSTVALPSLRQVAAVGIPPAAPPVAAVPVAVPVQGPVVPRWAVLGPGRPAWLVVEPVVEPVAASPSPAAPRTGRNPFAPLTR